MNDQEVEAEVQAKGLTTAPRVTPEQIEALRRASIVHSFRMGEKYSQNRIVEEAVQQWLDANGPWNA